MSEQKLPQFLWLPLSLSINRVFNNQEEWLAFLKELGIVKDMLCEDGYALEPCSELSSLVGCLPTWV